MKKQTLTLALLMLLTAGGTATASTLLPKDGNQTYVDLTQAAATSVESVVYIKVTQNSKTQTVEVQDPFSDFFGFGWPFGGNGNGKRKQQVQTPKRQGSGSGVIISADGYIVTNNHVVTGADEVEVKLNDNREFKARIIGTDETTDLALVKIEGKDLPAIQVGNSDDLKLGEWVLAVGNPFNLTSTVTAGIVSAKARTLGANGIESFIQTDAAINAGNSGGALVNARGELVGINAMLYSQTGSYSGYGFAIPTTIMNKVVSDLKNYGVVQRAVLGIQGGNVTDYIDRQKNEGKEVDLGTVDGVYVDEITDGSAADDMGLQKGDVITHIDGQKLTKMSEMQEYMVRKSPGDKVSITYLRQKKSRTATATLKNTKGTTKLVKDADVSILGAAFRPVTDKVKQQFQIEYGLEVTGLESGKLQEAGLKKGFIIQKVNGQPIQTIDDLQQAIDQANKKDGLLWITGITSVGKVTRIGVSLSEE